MFLKNYLVEFLKFTAGRKINYFLTSQHTTEVDVFNNRLEMDTHVMIFS